MSGKIMIFLLVSVYLIQGHQSRIAEPRGIVDQIVSTINAFVRKISDTIDLSTNQFAGIISNLQDKIDNIMSENEIDQFIEDTKNTVDKSVADILSSVGLKPEDVEDCIESKNEAVKQLVIDVTVDFADCRDAAQAEVFELTNELQELKNRTGELLGNSGKVIAKCIDDNGINVIGAYNCLKKYLDTLTSDANALIDQIQKSMKVGSEKLISVPANLSKCIASVTSSTVTNRINIVSDFKECVDTHVGGSTSMYRN